MGQRDFYQAASFCLAVAEHDNGWQEWEMLVGVDPKTFAPYNFMTVPTEEHITLYQRGIERIVKADLYAGLLVTSHCMGLYDKARATMPGYSAKYVRAQEQHLAADFVQRLRLQQLRMKVDLRSDPATRPYVDERLLKLNAQRLDALDRLSLYFCLGANADTTIESVPVNDEGREVDWQLRSAGGGQFTLDPYPFRRDPLEIAIIARHIPKRRYADEADLQKVITTAPFFNMHFTLKPAARKQPLAISA
jgi:hypothetical protein